MKAALTFSGDIAYLEIQTRDDARLLLHILGDHILSSGDAGDLNLRQAIVSSAARLARLTAREPEPFPSRLCRIALQSGSILEFLGQLEIEAAAAKRRLSSVPRDGSELDYGLLECLKEEAEIQAICNRQRDQEPSLDSLLSGIDPKVKLPASFALWSDSFRRVWLKQHQKKR